MQENNFRKIHLVDLVEVVYYLKQVFHLLYDVSVTPAEALLRLNMIDNRIIR